MKEADINFGSLYLCEIDGTKECKRILRKVPPEPGRQRSRTYVWENPDGTQPTYDFTVDASKIICPWSEYEKTPEYAERHRAKVLSQLNGAVNTAINTWYEQLRQYLSTITKANLANAYVTYDLRSAENIDDLMSRVMQLKVLVPLGDFINLTQVPLPPTNALEAAFETRGDVEQQFLAQELPEIEQALLTEVGNLSSSGDGALAHLDRYLEIIRKLGTPAEHLPLTRLASIIPKSRFLKSLTEEDQFKYLIPRLDWS